MQEFIEELKHNQKINYEKGLENRVDIDYVIERLEELNKSYYENFLKGETENVVENLINDNYMEQEHKEDFEKVQNLTQEDIKNIVEILLSDNGLAEYIKDIDSEIIEDTIFHYIHK